MTYRRIFRGKSHKSKLSLAIHLLREVRSQEFIAEANWDHAECRKWTRATDSLLDEYADEEIEAIDEH
jgi:hypothetical protein